MYIPAAFLETDQDVISDLIAQYPLGTLFTAGASGLMALLIPFLHSIK